jgi:hypothetical protein
MRTLKPGLLFQLLCFFDRINGERQFSLAAMVMTPQVLLPPVPDLHPTNLEAGRYTWCAGSGLFV